MASEISGASQEQAQGITEINKAVAQLEVVTQRNSTTSQQTATSADVLYKQADTLIQAVSDLVSTVQGGALAQAKVSEKMNSPKKPKNEVQNNVTPIRPEPLKTTEKKVSGESFAPRRTNSGFHD